jgi:aminoglycoside phosphotransferase (APT) family kinase protein
LPNTKADATEPTEPGAGVRLPGLDLLSLARQMQAEMADPPVGPLSGELVSGGRSNLTYRVTDGVRRWVVRRPPEGAFPPNAHDVGREFRVMAALASSDVPVPEVTFMCADPSIVGVPFYVMSEVPGIVIRSTEQFAALDESARTVTANDLVDTLARLHLVDPDEVGLSSLGRPVGYLERQVTRWTRQFHEVAVRDLPDVDRLSTRLADTTPETIRSAVVHGDYRLDNVIIDPYHLRRPVTAVLDWEMATLGDPLADLGNLLSCWDETGKPFHPITNGLMALPGVPARADVLLRYASVTGTDLTHIDWYVAFSLFKLAIVLEQIHARDVRGEMLGTGATGVGDLALGVLALAVAAQP